MNNINQICSILDANKIKYNKHFPHLEDLGFQSMECEALGEETVEALYNIVTQASRCGFKGLGKKIKKLIGVAMDLTDKNAIKKIDKLANDKEKAVASAQKQIEDNIRIIGVIDMAEMKVKQDVLNYLNDVSKAIDIVRESPKIVSQVKNTYGECIGIIGEIIDCVQQVTVDSTKASVDCASQVVENVFSFIDQLISFTCTPEGFRAMNAALDAARKWVQCMEAPNKKNKADDNYVAENVTYYTENEALIATVKNVLDSVDVKAEIQLFREQLQNNAGPTPEDIARSKARLEELKTKREELINQYDQITFELSNGIISENEANLKMDLLDSDLEICEEDIEYAEQEWANMQVIAQDRKLMESDLKYIVRELEKIQENPFELGEIGKEISFRSLNAMLQGNCSDAELDATLKKVKSAINRAHEKEKERMQQTRKAHQTREAVRQQTPNLGIRNQNSNQNSQQHTETAEERLARRKKEIEAKRQGGRVTQQPVNQTPNSNQNPIGNNNNNFSDDN